jgi:hypothetical protein
MFFQYTIYAIFSWSCFAFDTLQCEQNQEKDLIINWSSRS